MITRQFGIPVTSPGAILRRERDLGTPLGKKTAEVLQSGGLVSDKIIIELIEDWLRLRVNIQYKSHLFTVGRDGQYRNRTLHE